jgi:hypothetical protein
VRPSARYGINAPGTCILAVFVTCTSTLLAYPTRLSPPRSMTDLFASGPSSTNPTSPPLLPARLLSAIKVFISTSALPCDLPRTTRKLVASVAYTPTPITYSYITISVTHFTVMLFALRLLPSSGSPNGLPPRVPDPRSITNTFGWISEENLVAAKKSLTCLLRLGTQSSRILPTRPNRMGPSSVPIETLEIRPAPYYRMPPWHLVVAVWVLSFPPTPQHDHSR